MSARAALRSDAPALALGLANPRSALVSYGET
jgi:hypothetical protein